MAEARIIFEVPDAMDALAEALWMHHAALDGEEPFEAVDEVKDYLSRERARRIEAVFEDQTDPLDPLLAAAKALDEAAAGYLAVSESFTEPSRGVRAEARVIYGRKGERVQRFHPWVEGEPDFGWRSLVNAGFTVEEADEAIAFCFPDTPSRPKP